MNISIKNSKFLVFAFLTVTRAASYLDLDLDLLHARHNFIIFELITLFTDLDQNQT